MKRSDALPDDSHITRHLYNRQVHFTNTNGGKAFPDGSAFMLRQGESYLSVNWIEFEGCSDINEGLCQILEFLRNKRTVKNNDWLPVINVKQVIEHILNESEDNRLLKILYEPSHNDPSHSGIYGYTHKDAMIGDLIAEAVDSSLYKVEHILCSDDS